MTEIELIIKVQRLEDDCKAYNFTQHTLQEKIKELESQIEKMKADVRQGQSYWNSGEMQYHLYQRLLDKWEIKESD